MSTERSQSDREQENGSIVLKEHKVIRTFKGEVLDEIPVSEIKVIGEFTTANGPYIDDWFITIATKDYWYELSMYMIGWEKLLEELSEIFEMQLQYKFTNSTEWKTRIMYPNELAEKELYDWVDLEPKTTWEKFRKLVGFQKSIRQFTSEVTKILNKE
ncbi:MAG: hypothetical protein JKX84_01010 [Flavobacteriales bacterium]|nr:hypothetical protein [Flavobacteriales bacterium]